MSWTELTRRQHDREGGRYASDLTDAEWAVIEALMPPRGKTGRPRTTCLRDVLDAILYIATTGCQWRMLPRGFPPVSTVRGYFYAWRDDGLLDEVNPSACRGCASGRGAQGRAYGRHHRQSERENHRKRRGSRLRRRQEDQGTKASHRDGHDRTACRAQGSQRRDPGSRRRS